jgi:pyruvate dehydrogenase E2 component (dihydrolipoamide acetyltransferase)
VAREFKLPDLGEGVESGDVVNVLVAVGDTIQRDQGVIELETDKALIEVPSEVAGKVLAVNVKQGDTVSPGQVLISVEEGAPEPAPPSETASAAPPPRAEGSPAPSGPAPASPGQRQDQQSALRNPQPGAPPPPEGNGPLPAAPSTRRYARELGVNLSEVPGTGPGGRIVQADVQAHVRRAFEGGGAGIPRAAVLPDFSKWGPVERQPLPKIRQVIARNLSVAWATVPHVTQFGAADITDLESFRQRNKAAAEARGAKLTPTVLVLKAVVTALRAFPQFNASLDAAAGELVLKKYCNLGIAVDTERGLLVPVIKDADRKELLDLAVELADLGERTRTNKIRPDELQGGTFSITNLGSMGGGAFTPIVNHPEVAILGIGRGREEAVVRAGRVEPRTMMPLCLSYDHRVIDGADGVRFVNRLVHSLEHPEEMLLGG